MHWFYSVVVWKDDSVKCNVEVWQKVVICVKVLFQARW